MPQKSGLMAGAEQTESGSALHESSKEYVEIFELNH
jgi:hypothetical protein